MWSESSWAGCSKRIDIHVERCIGKLEHKGQPAPLEVYSSETASLDRDKEWTVPGGIRFQQS